MAEERSHAWTAGFQKGYAAGAFDVAVNFGKTLETRLAKLERDSHPPKPVVNPDAHVALVRRVARLEELVRRLCAGERPALWSDDPLRVCGRAKSDSTPCVSRDGKVAADSRGRCIGCGDPSPETVVTTTLGG